MADLIALVSQPWPWYVAGPLIGLTVPALLVFGDKRFGVSSSLRHICAAALPATKADYFRYPWRQIGGWNLAFVAGMIVGGWLAVSVFGTPGGMVQIADSTVADLAALGVEHSPGLAPASIFRWGALMTLPGILMIVVGGFLVGFGARYADGCTSGHGITGLATLQLPSLIAVLGFFAGGLLVTHLLLPVIV